MLALGSQRPHGVRLQPKPPAASAVQQLDRGRAPGFAGNTLDGVASDGRAHQALGNTDLEAIQGIGCRGGHGSARLGSPGRWNGQVGFRGRCATRRTRQDTGQLEEVSGDTDGRRTGSATRAFARLRGSSPGLPGRASCGCRARGWPALRKCHDRPSTPSQKGSGPGLISNERREGSDGQALAALGTAGAQHGTTTPAFLANQEAMSSFTTADGGLIGALHDGYQKGRGGSRVCEGRRRFSRNPLLDRQNEGFVNDFCASGCPDSRLQPPTLRLGGRQAQAGLAARPPENGQDPGQGTSLWIAADNLWIS